MTTVEIFTSIASVAQLIAIYFLIRQLRVMEKSNFASAFRSIYDILQSDDVRKARGTIMFELSQKPFETWTKEDEAVASKVCQTYDIAGNMVKNGLLPLSIIADSWGNSLRNCYPVLKPYLDKIRLDNNSKEIWDDFERLCLQSPKYQVKIRPDTEEEVKRFSIFNNTTK